MHTTKTILTFAIAALLLHGCATTTQIATGDPAAIEAERLEQARFAAKTALERRERLDRLAWPILTANADICPKARYMAGFSYRSRAETDQFEEVYRKAMRELQRLDGDRFIIVGVTQGSPAEESDLRLGDVIVAVEGEEAPVATSRRNVSRATKRIGNLLREAAEDGKLELQVSRDGRLADIEIALAKACDYPITMLEDPNLNAFADGNAIYVTTGMVRFASTDLELQTVLAHELAHNTEGHIEKMRGNVLLGALLGAVVDVAAASQGVYTDVTSVGAQAGRQAFSQDFEREADYVGIYYMERAGVDATEAASFWRRMAAEHTNAVVYGRTHPTTPERFVNIRAAAAEIRDKREAGAEMLPTRKRD